MTGILNAYQIQKYCSNVEHVIYEKNEDIGGAKASIRYRAAHLISLKEHGSRTVTRAARVTFRLMRTLTSLRWCVPIFSARTILEHRPFDDAFRLWALL